MSLYAKLDPNGTPIAFGRIIKLGEGTGEELRFSSAREQSLGYKIVRLMPVDALMEVAAGLVQDINIENVEEGYLKSDKELLEYAMTLLIDALEGIHSDEFYGRIIAAVCMAHLIREKKLLKE